VIALGEATQARQGRAHGTPRSPDDLKGHALIGYDRETPVVRSLQAKGMRFSRDMFALRTDSDLAHLAAIRAGYGIGVCQVPLARRDAELVQLLTRHFAFDLPIWLVTHERLRATARIRAVFDCLAGQLPIYIGRMPPIIDLAGNLR
jgi:DNA-binding transcriptional LysR family regulator